MSSLANPGPSNRGPYDVDDPFGGESYATNMDREITRWKNTPKEKARRERERVRQYYRKLHEQEAVGLSDSGRPVPVTTQSPTPTVLPFVPSPEPVAAPVETSTVTPPPPTIDDTEPATPAPPAPPAPRVPTYVQQLNARFAIVRVGSDVSETVVVEIDPTSGRVITRYKFPEFKKHLLGEPSVSDDGGKNFKRRADAWLAHPQARRYSKLIYAPPGSPLHKSPDPNAYNTWCGFAMTPEWNPKAAEPVWDFIRDTICAGNLVHFEWVSNWLAALVQCPGQHAHTAIVLKGGQGIGKGFFAEKVIGGLFDQNDWAHLTDPNRLTQQFNSLLAEKVVVFADEAIWSEEKTANKLKGLITADTTLIERKHMPVEVTPSTMHLIVASNAEQPLKVERDDRRLCVLQVDEARKQDTKYFGELQRVLDNGGREAFLCELQEYPIDEKLLREPPESAAKQRMKIGSLSVEDAWWGHTLSEADAETWETRQGRAPLFEALNSYAKAQGQKPPFGSRQQLGNFFATHFHRGGMNGWPKGGRDLKVKNPELLTSNRINAWEFPSLPECRAVYEKATGVRGEW